MERNLNKHVLQGLMLFFAMVLFSANFVGNHVFRVFYFTFSSGTLILQLTFSAILLFTEVAGKRASHWVIATGLINLVIALGVYYILQYPFPNFWTHHKLLPAEKLVKILMFSFSYILSGLAMVYMARWLKRFLGEEWLLVRVTIVIVVCFIVDMSVLLPTLYIHGDDRYLVFWKMLTLFSARMYLSMLSIPLNYAALVFFLNHCHKKGGEENTMIPTNKITA